MNEIELQYLDFHDAELVGVDLVSSERKVVLSFKLVAGVRAFIVLEGVESIRVCDYIFQNIVSRLFDSMLKNFLHTNLLDDHVEWLYTLSDGTRRVKDQTILETKSKVREGKVRLFVLEPSWGAELVCLCESIRPKYQIECQN
ncbi:hypothetical protein P3W66_17040 [Achromobacter denitrificans]|uniref:hypothetical protein n=1 Tax=Achromobacter denitrificans TaxID=32002 RepID=UPI0023E8AC01|nr:hypothetical protein [Achromobacter denitrificans]MDF3941755.1 hypothetical protein [Achromobacter denitrificans]